MALKDKVEKHNNVLATSGLSGKSITGVEAYFNGSVAVIEISYSGGTQYVKVSGQQIEIGGNEAWGTGTKVL